jgi:hypothetical protein
MQQKDALKVTGSILVRSHPAGTIPLLQRLHARGFHDAANKILRSGRTEVEQRNLIVDSPSYGIDILVQYLISGYTGSFGFPLGIAWAEIGTGTAAPASGDIALATPTNRAPVSYAADNSLQTAQLQFFFPDAVLANGTYYECGSFIGGTSSIGSGNMFNHALFGTAYSKSAGADTTLEIDITIT